MQDAIQKAWKLGRDENQMWDRDADDYWGIAVAQDFVNKGRRQQDMPVGYRSGQYSGNDSTDQLGWKEVQLSYNQLVKTSPPPWELPLILETIEALPRRSTGSLITQSTEYDSSEKSADGKSDRERNDSEGESDGDEDDGDAGS